MRVSTSFDCDLVPHHTEDSTLHTCTGPRKCLPKGQSQTWGIVLYRIAVVSRATRRVTSVAISIGDSFAGSNAMVPGDAAMLPVRGAGNVRFGPCVSPARATADSDTTSTLVAKNRASFDILSSFFSGAFTENMLASDRRSGLITGIIALLAIILASKPRTVRG